MNRLIIIGASGHGKVVADVAKKCGYNDIVFLDDDASINSCAGFPVLGNIEKSSKIDGDIFIAIGNPRVRKIVMERYSCRHFPILIHPNAVVSDDVKIGAGSVVMAGSVINTEARIGQGVIVNTCCSIDHDCSIADFCHVSVGAHICGTVNIGESTWIGAGATVSNNVNICGGCTIGAGAVVIKDIYEVGTYVGVPAKKKGIEGER